MDCPREEFRGNGFHPHGSVKGSVKNRKFHIILLDANAQPQRAGGWRACCECLSLLSKVYQLCGNKATTKIVIINDSFLTKASPPTSRLPLPSNLDVIRLDCRRLDSISRRERPTIQSAPHSPPNRLYTIQ